MCQKKCCIMKSDFSENHFIPMYAMKSSKLCSRLMSFVCVHLFIFVHRILLTRVLLLPYALLTCAYLCPCVSVCADSHSDGHEHVVVPGHGSHAAVSAAFPAGRHPEKEDGQDMGEHPACAGSAHLAAVPQDGWEGILWYMTVYFSPPSQSQH